MSPERRDEGGVPHIRRAVPAPPGRTSREEHWAGANDAKAEKLRGKSLQRQAGARGLELRHSSYGYALIDSTHKRIEDRNDMTLAEVESWLNRRT